MKLIVEYPSYHLKLMKDEDNYYLLDDRNQLIEQYEINKELRIVNGFIHYPINEKPIIDLGNMLETMDNIIEYKNID